MSAASALAILDSTFDLFKQMGGGIALDLQWLAISRRLQLVRAEVHWTADMAFVATKLKAHAAHYALRYRPDLGSEQIRRANAAELDKVVQQYSILRAHLEAQLRESVDGSPGH
ncbi:hypothetical protein SAMN05216360_103176 [Methylobacterium phyllostachyos]|uniref:Uncharacterized protein n=1 Tax=Methylobacterium phyllostachyos TaxID=582672 RepID=A0A1G9VGQ3_9HYPH|nr:hypothetical protein [Methylobacterium phyllostachyos]SDM71005.1 hypothetical protein SAMN05216360_103176 [Methylobacterium phyllostachyos]